MQSSGLILFFEEYRVIGFNKALDYHNEIAIELNIDPIFFQIHIIRRKIQFDENLNTPLLELSQKEFFRVNFFFYLIDQTIISFNKRFEQYQQYENIFDFLFIFHKLQ